MEKLFWPITVIGVCVVLLAVYNVFKAVIRKGNVPGRQDELEKRLARNREKKVNDEAGVSVDEQSAERASEVKVEEAKAEEAAAAVSVVIEPAGAKTKSTSENWASELWQRWCQQTGSWNIDICQVALVASTLTPLQLETLLAVYRNDHPDLYRGVISDAAWRKRCANLPAEFVGMHIEVLKNAYSATIPSDPKKLWNWWLDKTGKTGEAEVLRHVMYFMKPTQIEVVKQQLVVYGSSNGKSCTQKTETGVKNSFDFCRVQLIAVRAFLKAKR